jgi:hypothetical protein
MQHLTKQDKTWILLIKRTRLYLIKWDMHGFSYSCLIWIHARAHTSYTPIITFLMY